MNSIAARSLTIVAGIFMLCGGLSSALAGAVGFAAHRAVYDLDLDPSEGKDGLVHLSGRIVVEFSGSSCEGYSTALRYVTDISRSDGDRRLTDMRTVTFEEGDGAGLEFKIEVYVDRQLSEESRGSASRTESGVAVALTKPGEKNFTLDSSVVFPTKQVERLIEAGLNDQNFLQIDVYDGTDGGERVYSTTAVIGGSDANDDIDDESAAVEAGLSSLEQWLVTISYFDQDTTGEATPNYVLSFVLYENGVSRRLKIDYGNFAIIGRLADLELLPLEPCP